jgi:exodeoxyribonuclease VII small subunit
MTTKKSEPYAVLQAELNDILIWFEGDDFEIEAAIEKYKRGMEIVEQLEAKLETAQNTIRELKAPEKL